MIRAQVAEGDSAASSDRNPLLGTFEDDVEFCDGCGLPDDCCCPDGEFSLDDDAIGGGLDI